jgi:hypothetical protein
LWCADTGSPSTADAGTERHTYTFADDSTRLYSDSTLRFRDRDEVETTLIASGFDVLDVRDAPDRPSAKYVFISRRTS